MKEEQRLDCDYDKLIFGHLFYRYSLTLNHVMMAAVNFVKL